MISRTTKGPSMPRWLARLLRRDTGPVDLWCCHRRADGKWRAGPARREG